MKICICINRQKKKAPKMEQASEKPVSFVVTLDRKQLYEAVLREASDGVRKSMPGVNPFSL